HDHERAGGGRQLAVAAHRAGRQHGADPEHHYRDRREHAVHRHRDERHDERRHAREQVRPRLPLPLLLNLAHRPSIHDRRAATAVSGLSANTPSTPAAKNAVSSPTASSPTGRNRASSRNVQQWTSRPAAWASATSGVGVVRRPSSSRGMTRSLAAPTACAYSAISATGTSAPGATSWPIGTRRSPRSSRRLSNDSTITGASGVLRPAASSEASSGGPSGRPSRANRAGSLSSR